MRHLAAALAIALAVVAIPAAAQTYSSKVFVTVDAIQVRGATVYVTGIVQGESAPTTYSMYGPFSSDASANMVFAQSCQQDALLAMTKPGQYLLELSASNYSCKLTRVSP
jgi:hypothetical protein